jgi:hypothetical protein
MQRRRLIMAMMVTVLTGLTGCSASSEKPTGKPAEPGTAAPSKAAASTAPRYTTVDGGGCPTLRSAEAKQFNATGPGRQFRSARPAAGALAGSACSWGSGSGDDRPLLNAEVLIFTDGLPPTKTGNGNAQRVYSETRTRALREADQPASPLWTAEIDTAAGRSIFTADGTTESLTQTTVAENAVISVTVWQVPVVPKDPAAHARKMVTDLSAVTGPITDEIAAQLR